MPLANAKVTSPTRNPSHQHTTDSARTSRIQSVRQQHPVRQQYRTHVIYVDLQNGGRDTLWSDAGGYALACLANCMGAGPVGFGSAFVQPGQQFRFNIALVAPSSPGVYNTTWQLEHHGAALGPDLWIGVNVQGQTTPSSPARAAFRPLGQVRASRLTAPNRT